MNFRSQSDYLKNIVLVFFLIFPHGIFAKESSASGGKTRVAFLENSGFVLVPGEIGKQNSVFLVDSGAVCSFLRIDDEKVRKASKRIGMAVLPDQSGVFPVLAPEIPVLIGGYRLPSKFAISDFADISAVLGVRIDGIIGPSSFSDAAVRIDFGAKHLELERRECRNPANAPGTWFRMRRGIPLAIAELNGIVVDVGIDSGGDFGMRLPRTLFDYLVVSGKLKVTGRGLTMAILGGITESPEGSLNEVTVFGETYRNVRVKAGEGTPMVGINLLRRHDWLEFDFVHRSIRFGPSRDPEADTGPTTSEPFDWLGLRLTGDTGGRRFIGGVLEGTPVSAAGIVAGDEILSVDGVPVVRGPEINRIIETKGPAGVALRFKFRRGEATREVKVTPFDHLSKYIQQTEGEAWENLKEKTQGSKPDPFVAWLTSQVLSKRSELKLNVTDPDFALHVAAHGGEPRAMCEMGRKLADNNDGDDGLDWIRKAAQLGDPAAQILWAECLQSADASRFRNEKPEQWLERAALNGSSAAAFRLAESNRHSGQDIEAVQWSIIATKLGHQESDPSLTGLLQDFSEIEHQVLAEKLNRFFEKFKEDTAIEF